MTVSLTSGQITQEAIDTIQAAANTVPCKSFVEAARLSLEIVAAVTDGGEHLVSCNRLAAEVCDIVIKIYRNCTALSLDWEVDSIRGLSEILLQNVAEALKLVLKETGRTGIQRIVPFHNVDSKVERIMEHLKSSYHYFEMVFNSVTASKLAECNVMQADILALAKEVHSAVKQSNCHSSSGQPEFAPPPHLTSWDDGKLTYVRIAGDHNISTTTETFRNHNSGNTVIVSISDAHNHHFSA